MISFMHYWPKYDVFEQCNPLVNLGTFLFIYVKSADCEIEMPVEARIIFCL